MAKPGEVKEVGTALGRALFQLKEAEAAVKAAKRVVREEENRLLRQQVVDSSQVDALA